MGPGAGSELVTDPSWRTRAELETTSLHRRRWTRRTLLLVLIAVVLAGLVGIVVDNFELVEVGLLIRRVEARLGWALTGAGLIGFVVGLVVARLLRRP